MGPGKEEERHGYFDLDGASVLKEDGSGLGYKDYLRMEA
jgi:hypothetical protein